MKNILILSSITFLIVACSTSLPATEPSTKMMKKADTIILKVDETPKEAYKNLYQHLSDYGFGFKNTDKDLMLLKTDIQDYGNAMSSYAFSINASIRSDSSTTIVVNGNGNMGIGNDYEIYNTNNLMNNIGKSWNKMHDIVTDYPHQSVYYRRN